MLQLIRDTLNNKPSAAIRAMIEGTKEQDLRDDFAIDANTYGNVSIEHPELCFGCFATCAVQKIAKRNLTVETIYSVGTRAEALGIYVFDLDAFEEAMDVLRVDDPLEMLHYFGLSDYIDQESLLPANPLPCLSTRNWREELPAYEKYAEQLEALGL
jgi:hypothetical protein